MTAVRDYEAGPLGLEMEGFEKPMVDEPWRRQAVKYGTRRSKATPSVDEINRQLSLEDAAAEAVVRGEVMSRLKRLCNFVSAEPTYFERTCRELFLRGEISRYETIIAPADGKIWNIQLPVEIHKLRHVHGFLDTIKTVGFDLPSGKRGYKYVLTYWGRVEEIEGREGA